MTASALLRHGPGYAATPVAGLNVWMESRGFARVEEIRGRLAAPAGPDRSAAERAGYLAAIRVANSTTRGPW